MKPGVEEPLEEGDLPDADMSLITAYLAHEMTYPELVAVEERLITDEAFRRKVQPVIDCWEVPVVFGDAEGRSPLSSHGTKRPGAGPSKGVRRWNSRILVRIAATVALVGGPLAGLLFAADSISGLEGPPTESAGGKIRGIFSRTTLASSPAESRVVQIGGNSTARIGPESSVSFRPEGKEVGRVVNHVVMSLKGEATIDVTQETGAVYLGTPVARARLSPGHYVIRSEHRDSTMTVTVISGYAVVVPREISAHLGFQLRDGESARFFRNSPTPLPIP